MRFKADHDFFGGNMDKIFHFDSAVVTKGDGFTRVRFWARTIDKIRLQDGTHEAAYKADADIILLVDGEGEGPPAFPDFEPGRQTFEGPSIEVIFRGECSVDSGMNGLVVTVPDARLTVIRGKGLPFDEGLLQTATEIDLLGEISDEVDKPPHAPPTTPQQIRTS